MIVELETEYDACDLCGVNCDDKSSYLCSYKGYDRVATMTFCPECSDKVIYPWLESQKIKPTV